MIEPEVAFNDINDNMDLGEACLKYCIEYVMKHAAADLQFLHERKKNPSILRPLRRIFNRAQLETTEIHLLRGILSIIGLRLNEGKYRKGEGG